MQDPTPTPRSTVPTSLAVLVAAGTLVVGVLLGRAWGGADEATPTLSVPVPSSTGSATATTGPSVTPTSTPAAGSVSQGEASLSLSGGVNSVISFGRLTMPAQWMPPPGTISLTWRGIGEQTLSLVGTSFTSQVATDAEHTLSFTVNVDGTPVTYVSAAGECTVTISPALTTQMGGTFICTNLLGDAGDPVVNAQGSFSATG